MLPHPSSTLCYDNDAFVGKDTSAGCRMVGSPRTCCMTSSQQARQLRAAPNSDSRMSVKETRKRNMKAIDTDVDGREELAQDPSRWRQELNRNLRRGEEN